MVDLNTSLSLGKFNLPSLEIFDTLMFLEFNRALDFLFAVNRHSRYFMKHNYQAMYRSFENDGLFV